MLRVLKFAVAGVVMALAGPAFAGPTFASFEVQRDSTDQTRNFQVSTSQSGTSITGFSTRTGVSVSTDYHKAYATNGTPLSQVGLVSFSFNPVEKLGSNLSANMFFKGVSSTETPGNINNFSLSNFTGTIIFKPVTSGTFENGRTYTQSSVLLAVTFTNGYLTRGQRNGNGFGDTTGSPGTSDYNATEVSYFSDFLSFSNDPADRTFAASFTGAQTISLSSFLAGLGGSFDAERLPMVTDEPVPELSTWGMMLFGFGAIGGTIRRRKSTGAKSTGAKQRLALA